MPEHYKLVIVGDRGVGKTEVKNHVKSERLVDIYGPIFSLDLYPQKITFQRTRGGTLDIRDTFRRIFFGPTWSPDYNNADGIMLVYDITNLRSFCNIKKWHRDVAAKVNASPVFILVGNKSDLIERRKVPVQMAQDYADSNGFLFMEMSALSYESTHVVFYEVAESMYSRRHSGKILLPKEGLVENNELEVENPIHGKKEESCGKDCFWNWRWLKWWFVNGLGRRCDTIF